MRRYESVRAGFASGGTRHLPPYFHTHSPLHMPINTSASLRMVVTINVRKKQTRTRSKNNVYLIRHLLIPNVHTVVWLHFQFHTKTTALCHHVPTHDVIVWSRAYHFRSHTIMNLLTSYIKIGKRHPYCWPLWCQPLGGEGLWLSWPGMHFTDFHTLLA